MTIEKIATWLSNSDTAIAFTGAGISTESDIPDFRSPNGVWAKYQPVYFQNFLESAEARRQYWQQKSEGHTDIVNASPNSGHVTLAKWEHLGHLRGVITQNIDGLHQQAQTGNVLELHGTAREVSCLGCGYRADADPYVKQFLATDLVPDCPECGGILKHATISFGQNLSSDVLETAADWCRQTDLMFALGSSLVVTPAADLPRLAKQSGARLVIINHQPTPLDSLADVVIHQSIGEAVTQIDSQLSPHSAPGDRGAG